MIYYQDIYTMPIYNWNKVLAEGNFGFLHIESTLKSPKKVKEDTSKEAVNMWHELNDQYTDEFGQDESTRDLLEKKLEIGLLKIEYVLTKNKFKLTQIEIKEHALEIYKTNGKYDPNREIGILSKYLGSMIDVRKTTVHQYFTLKEVVKNG